MSEETKMRRLLDLWVVTVCVDPSDTHVVDKDEFMLPITNVDMAISACRHDQECQARITTCVQTAAPLDASRWKHPEAWRCMLPSSKTGKRIPVGSGVQGKVYMLTLEDCSSVEKLAVKSGSLRRTEFDVNVLAFVNGVVTPEPIALRETKMRRRHSIEIVTSLMPEGLPLSYSVDWKAQPARTIATVQKHLRNVMLVNSMGYTHGDAHAQNARVVHSADGSKQSVYLYDYGFAYPTPARYATRVLAETAFALFRLGLDVPYLEQFEKCVYPVAQEVFGDNLVSKDKLLVAFAAELCSSILMFTYSYDKQHISKRRGLTLLEHPAVGRHGLPLEENERMVKPDPAFTEAERVAIKHPIYPQQPVPLKKIENLYVPLVLV